MKKSKYSSLLKLFALTGLLMLLTASARAWRVIIPDCQGCGSRAETVVVDANGNVIAAGRASYGGDVVKLSGETGRIIWQFNDSHLGPENLIGVIALDSHGDIFAVIDTVRGVTKISGVTGKQIWSKSIGGSIGGCQSRFNAIAVDSNDDVVVAGTAGCLLNVAKLDGVTGNEKWHYEREGYGKAVAVDSLGNVAAAGIMNNNLAVVKLTAGEGQELWQREINGAGNFSDIFGFEQANAVAMEPDGSVVVAGSTSNSIGNFRDFTVAKYATNGNTQWIRRLDGNWCEINDHGERVCQANDEANALALGKDGSIFVAGTMQDDGTTNIPGANEHFHVIKFSSDGNVVWSKPAEDPPFEGEYKRGHAFSLAVNAFGNVVAAGVHGERFTLVKFWGRTGGRAWRRQLTSGSDPSGNGNLATRVVMDAASNVIAAGETLDSQGISKFTVVKLRREDGLDPVDSTPPPVPETVLKYAPVVYLHSEDEYRPDDPMRFIRSSAIRWSHQGKLIISCGDHTDAERGSIDVDRLGVFAISPYDHWPHSFGSCDHWTDGPKLKATDYTRPFDGSKRKNVLGQLSGYEKEGYYLDPDNDDNELRAGIDSGRLVFPGAPVFYEYVEHQYVSYWFFYPYDKLSLQAHEGDWEKLSIRLDSTDKAISYRYDAHGHSTPRKPEEVEFEGTHPVVYSAKGSHASYPHIGAYPTKSPGFFDHANKGPKWTTWNDLLRVDLQPWYGFGGAWGDVGEFELSTGPLGPSAFKNSLSEWNPIVVTEEDSERAIALNSVTLVRDPFSLFTRNFDSDQRTRITLFAENIDLMPGESASSITAQAEDSEQRIVPLAVEYAGKVPNLDWLTQIVVRLPDATAGEVWISISLRHATSNKALITIRP